MDWKLIPAELVERTHDLVLNPGELQGRTRDKSLEGALARVNNRVHYGLVGDVYDLAAAYAAAVAQGHCFNDANKRTAYRIMLICLRLNGGTGPHATVEETGQQIIALAQGHIDDGQVAEWLRERA